MKSAPIIGIFPRTDGILVTVKIEDVVGLLSDVLLVSLEGILILLEVMLVSLEVMLVSFEVLLASLEVLLVYNSEQLGIVPRICVVINRAVSSVVLI